MASEINDPAAPTGTDAAAARKLFDALVPHKAGRNLSLTVDDQEVPIPAAVFNGSKRDRL